MSLDYKKLWRVIHFSRIAVIAWVQLVRKFSLVASQR